MFNFLLILLINFLLFSIIHNINLHLKINKLQKAKEILETELLKNKKPLQRSNFEADIAFLVHMINFKIENVVQYLLKPSQIAISKMIMDEQFETWKEEIVSEVLESISHEYYKLLTFYFSEEGLDTFIAETVNMALMQVVLKENFDK